MNSKSQNYKSFVVLSHPRSGTSYFCNGILSGHEEIVCFDEIFNKTEVTKRQLQKIGMQPFNFFRHFSRRNFLNEVFLKSFEKYKTPNIGFKLFPRQVSKAYLEKVILNNKVILLKRENVSQAAVSYFIAQKTGQWDFNSKKQIENLKVPFEYIDKFYSSYYKEINDCEKYLENRKVPFLKISYESLFTQETLILVREFLYLNKEFSFNFRKIKVNSPSRYQILENFSVLNNYCKGKGYGDLNADYYPELLFTEKKE